MDTALELRLKYENNDNFTEDEITQLLSNSLLIKKLTAETPTKTLSYIFNLIGLSEIPFVENLEFTKKLIEYINKNVATEEGFSYTGDINDIVPCYNAMLLEAYVRLGFIESPQVTNALNWIKKYQVFDRNQKTTWQYNGICKHGGCMKNIPCYIGIGKTIRALITYKSCNSKEDIEVNNLIANGVKYMLRHKMYLRLSKDKPICLHITDNMFPQSYHLSLTDIVYITSKENLWDYKEVDELKNLLNTKAINKHSYKIDYIYKYSGYVSFDNRRGSSEFLTKLYNKWFDFSNKL